MKQRKKKKLPAPRAIKVNEVLRSKVGGVHEAKVGKKAKRARVKEQLRQEIDV